MVDEILLATKISAVRDAVARVRSVLPPSPNLFAADRTAREVVVLNLIAHQYGVLDWTRIHALASERLDDLLTFCDELARRRQL